jgi:hypothetical protein
LAQDVVQISARAAPICGQQGAEKVAFQQAAVETIRRGFDRFIIVGGQYRDDVRVVGRTPVTAQTYGTATATGYGNTVAATGTATTYYSGGHPIIGGAHRQGFVVKMFKAGDPEGVKAISARAELGADWEKIVKSDTATCFD